MPHTKLPLSNRHNQNPNITTVQMLTVLLQWLCGEVWEREFGYLWQQRTCQRVCSLVYIYITATESTVDCSLWLMISDIPVHMSQVTFLIRLHTCLVSHFWWTCTHVSCHISHNPVQMSCQISDEPVHVSCHISDNRVHMSHVTFQITL